MLYVFGGLPGVGKSTLARALAEHRGAFYLRIDTIEFGLGRRAREDLADKGYVIAYGVAADNLRLGHPVVADSANTIELTRHAWRQVAIAQTHPFVEIEIVCSDLTEHQFRVEKRRAGSKNDNLPTWEQVTQRQYEPWTGDIVQVDTAGKSRQQCIDELIRRLDLADGPAHDDEEK